MEKLIALYCIFILLLIGAIFYLITTEKREAPDSSLSKGDKAAFACLVANYFLLMHLNWFVYFGESDKGLSIGFLISFVILSIILLSPIIYLIREVSREKTKKKQAPSSMQIAR
ncbi:hypothetical protein [Rufibacter latericius]|uniref:Uncharacterized protein n=1 Tax=Rufibacter latericius TaxID=2487040 RepID=A0A3M9M8X7_9BACT|nr:hypothetical protein [Rufibacter latericius]RNI22030.1 hypothetical protein EFB08_23135 [Rufibacter latericius]